MVKMGVRTVRMQRRRDGEKARVTLQGMPGLEVKVAAAFLSCVTATLGIAFPPGVMWAWDAGGTETCVLSVRT